MSDAASAIHFGSDNMYRGAIAAGNVVHGNLMQYVTMVVQTAPAVVSHGLWALAEMLAIPQVNHAAQTFRQDFVILQDQIAKIAIYKTIHDCLHAIQIYCYDCIVRESLRFPDDLISHDAIADHAQTLREKVHDLHTLAEHSSIAADKITPWLPMLDQAYTALTQALTQASSSLLSTALRLIRLVLQRQPTNLNTSLNAVAREMRLAALIASLTSIVSTVTTHADTTRSAMFTGGLTAFTTLNEALTILIATHNTWQHVDDDLHIAHGSLDYDVIDLLLLWPDVTQRTMALCEAYNDTWLATLQTLGNNLSHALQTSNLAQVKICFHRYRRETSSRFYQVDVDLKRLCDQLQLLGEPLAAVLRMMS
jgi:hypothetical protein